MPLNGAIANTTLRNRKSEKQDGAETKSIFISACRLGSASTAELIIPRVRRATIGGRAFPLAAAHVGNSLPPGVHRRRV